MARARLTAPPESALYAPVKALLEAQGYEIKGEILGCDVVGVRGDEPPVVVELKRTFSLALVYQGLDRLALTDAVYLAVGELPRQRVDARRLCRRLGLGLIVVADGVAFVLDDPAPYRPRRDARRRTRLLREHQRRVGDPTVGGSTRVPIMTAYRQEAIRCARLLAEGPMSPRALACRRPTCRTRRRSSGATSTDGSSGSSGASTASRREASTPSPPWTVSPARAPSRRPA